uniref:Unk like zinc finger n=1 Tax=Canis lupus familiaris TaxID=9615 RepID=A0A8C0NMN7_CANLF
MLFRLSLKVYNEKQVSYAHLGQPRPRSNLGPRSHPSEDSRVALGCGPRLAHAAPGSRVQPLRPPLPAGLGARDARAGDLPQGATGRAGAEGARGEGRRGAQGAGRAPGAGRGAGGVSPRSRTVAGSVWGRRGGAGRGRGGLGAGGDPEGRGRARLAHARCIVLTENAVGFESGGGGAERVPPADGEADPLQVSGRAGRGGAGAAPAPPGRRPAPLGLGPRAAPAPAPRPASEGRLPRGGRRHRGVAPWGAGAGAGGARPPGLGLPPWVAAGLGRFAAPGPGGGVGAPVSRGGVAPRAGVAGCLRPEERSGTGAAVWGHPPAEGRPLLRLGHPACGVRSPPSSPRGRPPAAVAAEATRNAVCLFRYLKEFRTEQCALFVQHKCAQHRPFTCFHWHFLNQRRRRPLRRRDGTFNYSPDVYCSKYDEASGVCPDGDECPYLHRTTGDTERKYHLRYYKTGTCIHETDARGHCVKNGLHCAFAHGPLDLRPPVCDIRELQAHEALHNGQLCGGDGVPDLQPGVLASQAMIEKILGEDPRWQDANFVLGSYKTEQCPKPPRLCRQGYACPHYHNSRDRRRNPRRFQYRSTPCPSVKHGDEWGEPARCDSGDSCQYCHSRAEQQFHPEIYKSTKCNDMRQTGYCPRGPFCAFAHVEKSFGMANGWACRDLASAAASSSTASSGQPAHNHLTVSAAAHPLAPSLGSSVASSLASSAGSGSSSPTALPALPVWVHPLEPPGGTAEPTPGFALELHLRDGSLTALDKELDEHDSGDPGPTGPRSLGGSEPVTIPGGLPRSPSLHSSSSLSTSPLSSLSQSLSGPLVSSTMTPPQQPPTLKSEPGALGSSAASYSLGLNGVPGSIWDFVSGSFSPSPTPILNPGPAPSSGASPSGAELARVRRQLDEAKRKIRQWEESWQQVKQACDAWQREAKEAKERALAADSARRLALQKKEEVEAQFQRLQEELEGRGLCTALAGLRRCADLGTVPLPKLHSLQSQLRLDLEAVDGVIFQLRAKHCAVCRERAHGGVLQPCQHRVLCEPCAAGAPPCAYCEGQPLPW